MSRCVCVCVRVTRKNGGRGPDSDQMTQQNFLWPGTRQATSSTKVTASETRSRLRLSNRAERQTNGVSGSYRRASQKRGKKIQDQKQPPPPGMKRKEVKDRLLSPRSARIWYVECAHSTRNRETRAVGEREEAVQTLHRSTDRNSPRCWGRNAT